MYGFLSEQICSNDEKIRERKGIRPLTPPQTPKVAKKNHESAAHKI